MAGRLTVIDAEEALLERPVRRLEQATLGWNITGVLVLAMAAMSAPSVALAGFDWTP